MHVEDGFLRKVHYNALFVVESVKEMRGRFVGGGEDEGRVGRRVATRNGHGLKPVPDKLFISTHLDHRSL
jgi:hypothetical protein